MATLLSAIRTRVRQRLLETDTTNPFWTDTELLEHQIDGCKDLWRAVIDLHQGHFTTIDSSNVSLVAAGTTLTGVPADCFRVLSIEPRDLTSSGTARNLVFRPKSYKSTAFQYGRAQAALDPSNDDVVYYDILNAGSPVAAPSIVVSRALSSTVLLRLVYVHTLATLTAADSNPIPGESDNALIAWTVAWARAKEREDRMPDPAWLQVYSTDKQALLTANTPRQEQEEEVVDDFLNWS